MGTAVISATATQNLSSFDLDFRWAQSGISRVLVNGRTEAQRFKELYDSQPASDTRFWGPAVDNFTDPALLFNGTVYNRGGMTLEALREKIGDVQFFSLLKQWATQNRYGTVTTLQFTSLAERVSGMDLKAFFDAWIYQDAKPTSW